MIVRRVTAAVVRGTRSLPDALIEYRESLFN